MTAYPLRRFGRPDPASVAAADWVLRREKGELSEANERRFADWLAEDAAHVAAYEDALWALDAVSRHAGEAEILALRKAALEVRGNRGRVWWWTGAFGLAAAAVVGIALWTARPNGVPPMISTATHVAEYSADSGVTIYRTGIGERSTVTLPDSSVATLDTDSQIRVAYTSRERAVYLLKGQALFDVVHDKAVPFQVYAKGQRITAVGTIFNVRIAGEQVKVSMVEGSVKVRTYPSLNENPTTPVQELTLSAGEVAVAEPARPLVVRAVDSRQVASWTGGLLVFNDTPLSDAVAEINRYNTRPIAIADTAVGAYRVSGVFKSNDPEYFSRAMAEVLPIEIAHMPDGTLTLRATGD
jgi:transmembrane sensor